MNSNGENVIILSSSGRFCQHNELIVDDQLEFIECKSCGQRLNPFFAIKKLMRLSEKWVKQKAAADLAREEAEKRTRTKCDHCGRFTKINISIPDHKVWERAQMDKL